MSGELRRSGGRPVVWLLIAAGTLLVAWSLVVPAWGSPDENNHWQYAAYVHAFGSLPAYNSHFVEANEPPLYYILMSPFAATSYSSSLAVAPAVPPYPDIAPVNDLAKYLALHEARLATCILSLLTVLFAYLAGVEATGRRSTGVLAGALVAFLPEFTYRGAMFSTDALVTTLCAAGTWLMVRLVRRGWRWREGIALALVGGLALLSKVTGALLLAGAIVLVLSEPAVRWRLRSLAARAASLAIAPLIALPWFLYMWVHYGDPIGAGAMNGAVGDLVAHHSLLSNYMVQVLPAEVYETFVLAIGRYDEFWAPLWVYAAYGGVMVVPLVGVWRLVRQRSEHLRLVAVLLVMFAGALAAVLVINLSFTQPQGRYLLPALPALAVVGALGLEATPGWREHAAAATATIATLLGVADLALMVGVVVPAFGGLHW